MSRKKPPAMELKNAVNNLINNMTQMMQAINAIDLTLGAFIDFTGNQKEFTKWLKKKTKEQETKESKK